jgi:hypothetical protein
MLEKKNFGKMYILFIWNLCVCFMNVQVLRAKTFVYFFGILDSDFTTLSIGFICHDIICGLTSYPLYTLADTGNESAFDTFPCHLLYFCS